MSLVRKIVIENLQHKVPVSEKRIRNIVSDALNFLKAAKPAQFNIYFVNDRKITRLNRRYLKEDRPTDVISFDISAGKKEMLADIFISADTAFSNARKFNTTPDYELCLYAVHGVLHLLGFNDTTARQSAAMHRKEKQILDQFFLRK